MEFFRRAKLSPARLGILAGTFNPPTRAHLALAHAALALVEEVLFVLPRAFPHKDYAGASFEERLRMLEVALGDEPCFSVGATEKGLFVEIAGECHAAYGDLTELYFVCGRDAAERVMRWDYGRPDAFRDQLRQYQLLVAPRKGGYQPLPAMRDRIHVLPMEPGYDEVSATEVRERVGRGEPWEFMVPETIVPLVREIYGAGINSRLGG